MPKDSPAHLNPAIENGPGTPQDGTIRHKVVDSDGNVLEAQHVGRTSVHDQGDDESGKGKRQAKQVDKDDDGSAAPQGG